MSMLYLMEKKVIIAGIMEHIEEAGIHSGDSTCTLPPYSLSEKIIKDIEKQTKKLANCTKSERLTKYTICNSK